tara:strand:- start:5527 stop:5748 length:222 start_codon:yes stop_codon:yes gene_type:complete
MNINIDKIFMDIRNRKWGDKNITINTEYDGMHVADVEWVITKALWQENNNKITLTITKGVDDHHLNIKVDKLE